MACTDRSSFAAITSGRVFASAILRKRSSSCGVHRLLRRSAMELLFPLRLQPQLYCFCPSCNAGAGTSTLAPIARMARPPRLDPGDVHGAAEVTLVLRLGEPAGLAGGPAGRCAARRRTVILVTAVTWVRTK